MILDIVTSVLLILGLIFLVIGIIKGNRIFKVISIILIIISIVLFSAIFEKIFIDIDNIDDNNYTENENTSQLDYKFFENSFIPYDDMEYFNNVYYKKIDSQEEYDKFKTKVTSLPECETDFNKYFKIIIMTENTSTQYFKPYKVFCENNVLYIGLIKDVNANPNSSGIILNISKDLEKDIIEPYKAIDEDIPYKSYAPIRELPANYTPEEAQADNCYVTQTGKTTLNKELAKNFINNYDNSQDAFIRKVQFVDNEEIIADVYYSSKENKFLVCIDSTRRIKDSFTYNYYKYSDLEKKTLDLGKNRTTDFYILKDAYEDDYTLFNM